MAARFHFLRPFPRDFNKIKKDIPVHTTSTQSKDLSDGGPFVGRERRKENSGHVNYASLERGVTKYYCNRNPRSLELLGMADKPLGYATKNQRMDYYHRWVWSNLAAPPTSCISGYNRSTT